MLRVVWRKIIKFFGILALLGLIFCLVTVYQNNNITVTDYKISSSKISDEFDGFRILQLSDVHSEEFGENNSKLIKIITDEEPDVIAITGDLVDANRFDFDSGVNLCRELVDIATVYFVYGNHEMILNDDPEENEFKLALEELGVKILNNDTDRIYVGDSYINVLGVQDPATVYKDDSLNYLDTQYDILKEEIRRVTVDTSSNEFNVLLSHRPEYFELYSEYDLDLVLTGHAHGGQFRIPFIGGLYAPNQGFFPKYTSGIHELAEMSMVINRGVGNSKIPIRIFNQPEITVIELKKQK